MTLPKKTPKNIEFTGSRLDCTPTARASRSFGPTVLSALLLALLFTVPATANENKNFSIGLSGLVGGPFDADSTGPDPGLDNSGFSAHFAWRTQPQTKVVARIAKMDLEGETIGTFADPEISYLNVGGEYTFREPYYTSGFYIGLGLYRLEGLPLANTTNTTNTGNTGSTALAGIAALGTEEESTLGIALGVTADFSILESVSLFAELSFHYADLDQVSFLGFLHVGIAYHF